MDKPLVEMTMKELIDELVIRAIGYTALKHDYIREVEKEILKRVKEK